MFKIYDIEIDIKDINDYADKQPTHLIFSLVPIFDYFPIKYILDIYGIFTWKEKYIKIIRNSIEIHLCLLEVKDYRLQ